MGRIIGIIFVLSAAVALALLMRFSDGNLALLWPPYRVDISISLVLIVLLATFVLGHVLLLALSNALGLPARVRDYRARRKREAAFNGLRDGLLAFFEGRFGRAERLSQVALSDPSLAGPAALVAARAAHRMREPERTERWLSLADQDRVSAAAAAMSRAEIAVEDRRSADALEAVSRLHARGARHLHSLRIALRAHEQAGDWQAVLQLVRQLEKREALHPTAARGLKIRAFRSLFTARVDDAHALSQLVASLTAAERDIDEIVEAAALALSNAGSQVQAAALVVSLLERRLSEPLVSLYAGLNQIGLRERLRQVEAWRARHGEQACLLMAAGRLCAAEGLWGKAESLLSAAESAAPSRATRAALAELFEHMGRHAEALRYWRLAASERLAQGGDTWPPAPRTFGSLAENQPEQRFVDSATEAGYEAAPVVVNLPTRQS
jgi:HemY protein